jgi:cytochrome c553
MKRNILVAVAAASTLVFAGPAFAGDAAAGKTKAEACAECHEPADFAGEDAATLEQSINDIVAGKAKHKPKLDTSAADAADIAAYWAAGS